MPIAAAGSFLLQLPDVSTKADIQALQAVLSKNQGGPYTANLQPILDAIAKIPAPQPVDFKPVLDAIAKIQVAPGPTPNPTPNPTPTPTPAPGNTGPWPPSDSAKDGDTISIPEGTVQASVHTSVALTVQGAGMRKTILDGQRGVGAGHRLAWGKGIIHAGAGITIQGVGFVNGGGGDNKSDAEAGFYAEGPLDETVRLVLCAFDACENGIFVPGGDLAPKIDLVLDRCVFGRNGGNGLSDGRSHDLYVSGRSVSITGSIFAGDSEGNTVKCRGPRLALRDNFIARTNGRWVDCPGGTDVVSQNNTYVTWPGSNVQNAIGLYDENDGTANPGAPGSFMSDGDTFYFSRTIGEHIWIANANTHVEFRNTKVFWIGEPGAAPPNVVIDGPGQFTGANPFIFNQDNRVSAPPALPADPV